MYVSKDLALILKERGYCQELLDNKYWFLNPYDNKWHLSMDDIDYDMLYDEYNMDNCIAPTEHQVVHWIFNCDEPTWIIGSDVPDGTSMLQCKLWWLQFWYTTLLEHKFSLMYEFIGRLEEWFESNKFDLFPNRSTYGEYYYTIYKYFGTVKRIKIDTFYFDTKQQAKHEAIMKCFELLKTDKHEE